MVWMASICAGYFCSHIDVPKQQLTSTLQAALQVILTLHTAVLYYPLISVTRASIIIAAYIERLSYPSTECFFFSKDARSYHAEHVCWATSHYFHLFLSRPLLLVCWCWYICSKCIFPQCEVTSHWFPFASLVCFLSVFLSTLHIYLPCCNVESHRINFDSFISVHS
jgi:hypothetical protein